MVVSLTEQKLQSDLDVKAKQMQAKSRLVSQVQGSGSLADRMKAIREKRVVQEQQKIVDAYNVEVEKKNAEARALAEKQRVEAEAFNKEIEKARSAKDGYWVSEKTGSRIITSSPQPGDYFVDLNKVSGQDARYWIAIAQRQQEMARPFSEATARAANVAAGKGTAGDYAYFQPTVQPKTETPLVVDLDNILVKTEISTGKYVGADGKKYGSQEEAKKSFFSGQNVVFGSTYRDVPSIAPPTKEQLEQYFSTAEGKLTAKELASVDEASLKFALGQPTQTIKQPFMSPFEVSSDTLKVAKIALEKPVKARTLEEWQSIVNASQISENYSLARKQKQVLSQQLINPPKQLSLERNVFVQPSEYDTKRIAPIILELPQPKKPVGGYKPSQIRSFESLTPEISQFEYDKRIMSLQKQIDKEVGVRPLVLDPNKEFYENLAEGKYFDPNTPRAGILAKPIKAYVENLFNFYSNVIGYTLSSDKQAVDSIGSRALEVSRKEKFVNPRLSAFYTAQEEATSFIPKKKEEFYTGRFVAETVPYLIGGEAATIAMVGGASRAKSGEELVLPLAFGAFGRLSSGYVSSKLAAGIKGFNEAAVKYSSKLLPKVPTPLNMVVPDLLPKLTDATVARGLILGGVGIEYAGLQLTPMEDKAEYLRMIGVYNAVTPVGYRATDVGLMVGKYAGVRALDVGGKLTDAFNIKYKGESLRPFDSYKLGDLSSEPDLSGVPTFVGPEKELAKSLLDTSKPGVGAFYKKLGKTPLGTQTVGGLRSGFGELADRVKVGVSYYELGKQSFFASEVNPMGLRQAGLKAKLLGSPPGYYAEYSFGSTKPYLEFATGKQFTYPTKAFSARVAKNFDKKLYEQIKELFSYSKPGLGRYFSKDVTIGGVKIAKGTPFGEFDFQKILGGGRSIKSREIINLIGEKNWEKLFLEAEQSAIAQKGGFYSSQSRILQRTTENEFATSMERQRIQPMTRAKAFARKYLKTADAYLFYDFEAIPINYERLVAPKSTGLVLYQAPKLVAEQKRLASNVPEMYSTKAVAKTTDIVPIQVSYKPFDDYFPFNQKLLGSNVPAVDYKPVVALEQGGYSKELESVVGKLGRPKYNPLRNLRLPLVLTESKPSKKKVQEASEYGLSYSPVYKPVYSPDYAPIYKPTYPPVYKEIYEPTYTPTYKPTYTPVYTPEYLQTYKPVYTPTYTPTYTPPYKTNYKPPYKPTYTPNYTPTYKPPARPPTYRPSYPIITSVGIRKPQKAFNIFARVKGKAVKIGEKLPYGKAFNLGSTFVSTRTSKSFYLQPSGFTSIQDIQAKNLERFRRKKGKSKLRENVFIERNAFAIDTMGEKLGLRKAKIEKKNRWF